MRVLVCGGRDYTNYSEIEYQLGGIHAEHGIDVIIEGGASGADTLGRYWAQSENIKCVTYPANWKKYRKSAGPIRNQRMLVEGKPDLVVAFPGGRGTADMTRRAEAAGIPVIYVK